MSADNVYLSTTSAHLSEDEEGNTDINEGSLEDPGPTFNWHKDKGIPPRTLTFTATIDRPAVAATRTPYNKDQQVIKVRPGNSIDLTVTPDVNVPPILVHPTPLSRPLFTGPPASVTSTIPHKASRACTTMHELSTIHQTVMTTEENSEDDDLLDLVHLRAKNKRCCRRRRQEDQ